VEGLAHKGPLRSGGRGAGEVAVRRKRRAWHDQPKDGITNDIGPNISAHCRRPPLDLKKCSGWQKCGGLAAGNNGH
jgi:hypothetical protein